MVEDLQKLPWETGYVPGSPRIAVDYAGEGALVLFMHGLGADRRTWHDQLPYFGKACLAVAWDARGYGLSDKIEGEFSFAEVRGDILRLIKYFGAAKINLVGQSMGGLIAQDFCAHNADYVQSLVLVNTTPSLRLSMTDAQVEEFIKARREPLVNGMTLAELASLTAPRLLADDPDPFVLNRLIEIIGSLNADHYLNALDAVVRFPGVADLRAITVPTLVIAGAYDALTPPDASQMLHHQIPGSEYVLMDDVGHMSNMEKPTVFNAAVADFYKRQLNFCLR